MSKFILFALICFYASTTSYAQGNCTKKEPLYIIYTDTDNFDIVNLKNDSIKVGYDLYLFNVKKSGAGYDYSLKQEGNLVTKLHIVDDSAIRQVCFMDFKTSSPVLVNKKEIRNKMNVKEMVLTTNYKKMKSVIETFQIIYLINENNSFENYYIAKKVKYWPTDL